MLPENRTDHRMLRDLLAWYDASRRSLPWREDPPVPYHVLLSEIMLQQTRVEAVKPYYARFLAALPAVGDLAAAPEDVCLKLWEGLGYYSRIRNLHRAAVQIVNEYDGHFPEEELELRKLPGVGDYTAAAIASIAFGKRAVALDGNLLRIFARMTACGKNSRDEAVKKKARVYFEGILDAGVGSLPGNVCGDFNQALMDLGATICLPNSQPLCERCPWKAYCEAHTAGREMDFPVLPAKKPRKMEEKTVLLIRSGETVALRQRPKTGLLAGMMEFPNEEGHLREEEALAAVRSYGFSPLRIRPLPPAKHIFTHKEWHMTGYEILADELAASAETTAIPLAQETPDRPAAVIPSGSLCRLYPAAACVFDADIPPDIKTDGTPVIAIPSAFSFYRQFL